MSLRSHHFLSEHYLLLCKVGTVEIDISSALTLQELNIDIISSTLGRGIIESRPTSSLNTFTSFSDQNITPPTLFAHKNRLNQTNIIKFTTCNYLNSNSSNVPHKDHKKK